VINYRVDLLKQAGVDEKTAFTSMGNFRDTIRKLKTLKGVAPWVINTARDSLVLHVIAPWVWDAGGQFITSDGHKTKFAEPEALSGMQTYFETFAPIITPENRNMVESVAADKFIQGKAAGIISGHWIADSLYRDNADTVTRKKLRVVPTPGAQMSGSMNLAIWKHCLRVNEALKLVQFLTRPDIQAKFIPEAGFLPVRLEALDQPPYTTDPNFNMLKESLISGRHINAAYMWGMVEDQLVTALHSIWQTIFDNPEVDLGELIAARLKPLAARLDRKLSFRF
jgi:multiple sugar transport system substrate-binding protein